MGYKIKTYIIKSKQPDTFVNTWKKTPPVKGYIIIILGSVTHSMHSH